MKAETKWMAVVVSGPTRQHLMHMGVAVDRKRDVWGATLKAYQRAFRDDDLGHAHLVEDWKSGRVRPMKVTVSWENAR